jgi:O-antigen/teichoic acid export membrane protein
MATATDERISDRERAGDERHESELERLDRNTVELLNELRVAGTGIQVLFAFLLVVPFNAGYNRLSSFDHYDYYVTLVCVAAAAVLLMSPSIHHRLLFRHGEKPFLIRVGNTVAIVAMAFLTVGMTGILVLISDVMFGGVTAVIAGVLTAVLVGALWFAVPLRRRLRPERQAAARRRQTEVNPGASPGSHTRDGKHEERSPDALG